MWETAAVDPDLAREFTARMHSYISAPMVGAARAGVFSGISRLLDIGGGSGAACIAAASTDPGIRCTVFDLPAVCGVAEEYVRSAGLQGRIDTAGGSFRHDQLPGGYDGMLLSNILHDWRPEIGRAIIRKAHDALLPKGKLLVHEMLYNESPPGPLATACFSMMMFINHGARQYTQNELTTMLEEAGFRGVTRTDTFGYYSILSASK